MALERWDPQKRKYVLYEDSEQHGSDCTRFPFNDIPRRVFLDTNVINVLVKHNTHIFEGEALPTTVEATLAVDTEALMHVFHVGARADWDLIGSQKTLDELSATRDELLRDDLLEYAFGLVNQDLDDDERFFATNFGRLFVDAPFAAALPDRADRELIGNAIGYGCDAFCTRDRATIASKRDQLGRLPLRIITPAEWWGHVKPWAGLLV
ncbi:MAG TPA: hypothetical protein VK629_20215 [Steroidobacteraceae bacterium]|nr:hypothetical protein [Steroidobacteraceae bacterium]